MIHVLLIDPLEKLSIKKDTSLLLAATLKQADESVYLMFPRDFYFGNDEALSLRVFAFESSLSTKIGYVEHLSLTEETNLPLNEKVVLHFRLDPPFDTNYLRYLWMIRGVQKLCGVRVINDPGEVCQLNEKMIAYEDSEAVPTYVGASTSGFQQFCLRMEDKGVRELILKPLDLYQGIGVEKVALADALECFEKKCLEYKGAVVAQPFLKEVAQGEKRSIYFAGEHLGTILKVPPQGEFLANIAQGATYDACPLTSDEEKICRSMALELAEKGVPWVAFDLLGGKVQEANITCPGLLVEVSHALEKNLALTIIEKMSSLS